jgi:perosamine synthetase
MTEKIPLARPYVGEEEIKAVSEVIRSGWLSLGPKLTEFENRFADFIGAKHAVAVNSGTSGLHLCIKALNIGPGDQVITSSFSFVASSNPIILEGGNPVFVDIDERTYNIDPQKLEDAITEDTKAIVLVHIFGQPCNMEAIMRIAERKGIPIIEDACEALGAAFDGRKVGTFGQASVFAFYPNKQITTGEGGIIVTDNDEIAAICRSWRNQGRDDSGEWLNHVLIGYNYRMDELSCAMGLEQLKKVEFILNKRRELADKYGEVLKQIDEIVTPYVDPRADISWWVYYLQAREGLDRDKVLRYLNENGVSSRSYFYPPIHLQPVYKKLFGYVGGELPVTERVSARGFIIPFFIDMTDEQIDRVCTVITEAVRKHKR